MKKKKYISIWMSLAFLLAVLVACTVDQEVEDLTVLPEGSPIEVTFGSFTCEICPVTVRSINTNESEDNIEDFRLLVFDELGNFLYSRKAVIDKKTIAPTNDNSYLPDGKQEGIETVYKYSAKLLSTSKKRFIHFIANHDWNDFPQDYFLLGQSEGELIPALTATQNEFWRRIEFNGLNENSLEGKVVKLLRNQAKISITYNNSAFNIKSAKVHNAYDKGTVAPYTFLNETLTYSFLNQPQTPTIPIDTQAKNIDFVIKDKTYEVDLFEHSNEGVSPLFVIIEVENMGFYKIDLKKVDTETGITTLYDIVRNYWYKIEIQSIVGKGYDLEEEAAKNRAGNNLLSSVELEKYPSVSDGVNILYVEKMEAFIVKDTIIYTSEIYFSAGINKVEEHLDFSDALKKEYIKSIVLDKTYGDENTGLLTVEFIKIPNETVQLPIHIVAKPNPESTYGVITRKINITLRPPYQFNATLTSNGIQAKDTVTISFDVPSMAESLFPFKVLFNTKELTPVFGQNMSYEIKDADYYIKYLITEKSRGKQVKLKFHRNISGATEKIKMVSDYYETQVVDL